MIKILFICRLEDAEELSGLAAEVMEKSNAEYGEPSTYPGLQNRLSAENFSGDLMEAMDHGTLNDWREEWPVGGQTRCTLSVRVAVEDTAYLCLKYAAAK